MYIYTRKIIQIISIFVIMKQKKIPFTNNITNQDDFYQDKSYYLSSDLLSPIAGTPHWLLLLLKAEANSKS